jgi:uncharacterized protein (TIGR03067 family)
MLCDRSTMTIAALIVFVAATKSPGDQPMNNNLIGVWTCTAAIIDGRPLADETVKQLRLTLTADRYKSERDTEVLFDGTYKLDATKDPAHIDMTGTEGDFQGKNAPGIFKLDGDALTLCYVMPGKQRPTKFVSEPQSGVFLVVYRRADAK